MRTNETRTNKGPQSAEEAVGIDARDVLAGETDDTTVRQAVEVGDDL
ncbi:hypothetical protein [Halorubrum tropicale]|nr:hypothetical protein [Halorubrum tropicale]